jgi:hypothetical protein
VQLDLLANDDIVSLPKSREHYALASVQYAILAHTAEASCSNYIAELSQSIISLTIWER